jgi:hypothetical protein
MWIHVKQHKFTRLSLQKRIDIYFSDEESVKSFAGLALFLGTDTNALARMLADSRFADILALAGTHIEKDIIENGLKGKYNATMSSFLLKTVFGYSEKGGETAGDVRVEVSEELKRYAV